MKIESLIVLIERSSNEEIKVKGLSNLLNAISDWTVEVDTVEEYLRLVKMFLDINELDFRLIEEKTSEIDYQKFSSEVESISELLIYLKKNNEKTQLPHEY